jgi:methylated-DNA-[protein]-cysteine S-methyltransferase
MKQNPALVEDLTRPGSDSERDLRLLLERVVIDGNGRAQSTSRSQAAVSLIPCSPVGPLMVCLGGRGIVMIQFLRRPSDPANAIARLSRRFDLVPDQNAASRVGEELDRFAAGDQAALRSKLDLSLVNGSFQRRVLERLLEVRPGAILTYSALAAWTGAPYAARAVGGAMHDNPIPVYVPCHRVIASDLSLGGYGGGLEVKRKLLEVEGFSFTPKGLVAQDGAVWGNRNTRIFCRPNCRAAARADRRNGILFRGAARASISGMRACRICRPEG